MKALLIASSFIAIFLIPSIASSQELLAPLVDGRINVTDEGLKAPFLRDQRFFPGERVELLIDFRIDAMRRMHEDRECWSGWFGGIDCHYVKRSDASGLPASQVPLTLSLRRDELVPDVTPAMVKDNAHDTELQFPPSTGTFTFTLNITEPQLNARFTQGYSLIGRVAPKYGNPPALAPIDRRPCSPFRNGQYCSQGEYVVTIKSVDTSTRFEMLKTWLSSTSRSARDISASIDSWMLFAIRQDGKLEEKVDDRKKIAALLLQHVNSFHQVTTGQIPSAERLPILELARQIDPTNPSIASAIVQTQIASGDIVSATTANNENIAKYEAQYETSPHTEPVLRGYAEALANAASILRERSFDLNPGDVRRAVDYYNQSATIWSQYLALDNADLNNGNLQYIKARLEQAKSGARVSDLVPLKDSIAALVEARSRLPREQNGIATAVGGQGSLLVVDDHFSAIGQDEKTKIALGFLPQETQKIVDVDSQGGRLLIKEGFKAPLTIVDMLKRTSTMLPEDVDNGIICDGSLLTVKENKLFRVVDGVSTEVAAVGDDYLWAVARGSGTIATVKKSVSEIKVIDGGTAATLPALPLLEISAIALSRDGKKLLVDGRTASKRTLSIVDVASGSINMATPTKEVSSDLISFNNDTTRATLWRKDGTLEVLDTATGAIVEPELEHSVHEPVQLSGNEVVVAVGGRGEAVRKLLVVALDKVASGPTAVQPQGAISSVKLDLELPADAFRILSPSSSPNSLIVATTSIGTATTPVVARVMNPFGKVSADVAITDWHPDSATPIGDAIGINPVKGNWARIVSTDGSPTRVFQGDANARTVIVPVGKERAFLVITYNSKSSISRVEFYSTPQAPAQTVDIEQRPDSKWELLKIPIGPFHNAQQHVALVDRPDPGSNSEIGLATFNSDGAYWTARKEIEHPEEIVDILPGGKGYLRHVAKSFVFESPDGSSAALADCEGRPNCAIEVFQPSGDHYVVAVKADRALEATAWDAATLQSANCNGCDRFDLDAASAASQRLPYGFESSEFSLGGADGAISISYPTAKTVLTSRFNSDQPISKPGGGMPLLANASGLVVQAGSLVKQWANAKSVP